MRLVQVLIPEGTRADALEALDSEGVDYALFEEVGRGDFEAMVQFPVPPSGVELVEVNVDYDPEDMLLGREPQVSVLVGIPRGAEAPPDLAQRWDDDLTAELDRDVVVRVGFVEAQVSESEPPEPPIAWPARPTASTVR